MSKLCFECVFNYTLLYNQLVNSSTDLSATVTIYGSSWFGHDKRNDFSSWM